MKDDFDKAWWALTGRDDPWGGCNSKPAVERIVVAIREARHPIAGALSERAGQAEHVPSEIVKTAAIAFLNNHASMSRMEVREAAWWFIDYASRMALEEANRR